MTLRVNPEFATALGAAMTSNLTWSNAFKNGLGNTRRVICKFAPAGTPQEDVYTTGTKFRDAAITGTMVVEGGVVTSYGVTSNLTTSLAANLSTSVAVLRIEGNGNWVEGTLGLVGSNADFVLPSNPTTTNSIAVLPNVRIKPPPYLWSGTGFTPPNLDADAPSYIRFINFQNPAAPVEIGKIYFNKRIANWVFTDAKIADGMGDVRVTQSTDKVAYGNTKFGNFEFGAMLFSMNSAANGTENKTLHQTLISCKPAEDNWPRYPAFGGYRRSTRQMPTMVREYGLSKTFPPAFKAEVCKADGTVLHTHQMPRDNLPINSDELTDYPTTKKPMRAKWHCGMVLFWQSHEPKMNPHYLEMFSGLDARVLRQTNNKGKAAINGSLPIYNVTQSNGIEHWYASAKWASPCSAEAVAANPSQDPYLYNMSANTNEQAPWSTQQWAVDYMGLPASEKGSLTYGISYIQGWGFEPGNPGIHGTGVGPGSVRIDRSIIPGPIGIHISDPTWVHLRDNTPISEMVSHWNMGYANHAFHYFKDVATFETLPIEELCVGKWGFSRSYYNPNDSYVVGGVEYSVPLFARRDSVANVPEEPHLGYYTDENYSMPWNGCAVDAAHNYQTPFYTAALYCSPAHAYMWKHRYIANILLMAPNTPADAKPFGLRDHAWYMMHEVHAWMLGSDHVLGVTRQSAFDRMVAFMNSIQRDYYVPLYVNNDQSVFMKILRNFGLRSSYNGQQHIVNSFGLHFYMTGVLTQMRAYGLWDLLWNHSTTVRQGMTALIKMLDTSGVAYVLQTSCRYSGSTYNGLPYMCENNTSLESAVPAADWADWFNRLVLSTDKAIDLTTKADGTPRYPDVTEQLKVQYVKARKDYFGDIPCDYDLDAAYVLVESWWAARETYVNDLAASGASKYAQTTADWSLMPGYAPYKPPVTPLF